MTMRERLLEDSRIWLAVYERRTKGPEALASDYDMVRHYQRMIERLEAK